MADIDTVDVKPKILSPIISIGEVSDIVPEQKTLSGVSQNRSGSMTRPSKLFIKVDSEGLLTDTIAISDVVDFSCYESIVSSACRIIACFQSAKPQNIEVEALFYYKKRARSTRMNPVQIRSTTDAFKAVAEHPVGEVPIGVRWSQRLKYRFTTLSGKTTIQSVSDSDNQNQSPAQLIKIVPRPSPDASQDTPPEKKQKLEDRLVLVDQKGVAQNATTHISPFTKINQAYPCISSEAFKGSNSQTTSILQKVLTAVPPENPPKPVNVTVLKGKPDDIEGDESDDKHEPPTVHYIPRQIPDPQYMFPKDARTEFVVTYGDGVVEKRKLPEDVCRVVQMMLRGNYSYLTKEAQASLGVGLHGSHLQSEQKRNQTDNYPTGSDKSGVIQFQNDKPIRYIKDAKSEIFRILSMLSVSKTRFKSLLKWMKTLKLEDGKKGKYFLSARDIIGGTKYLISSGFETDEQNVLKHDQSYRPYGSSSTDTSRGVVAPSIPEPPHNQIMFLMPTSAIPSNATPVFKTSSGVTMVPTSKVVHISPVQSTPQASVTVTSSSRHNTSPSSSVTNVSRVVGKHPRKPGQPLKSRDSSPNPVPMNLFKASQHSESGGLSSPQDSSEKEGSFDIKVEPHDYDSETSDATMEYDRHSERDSPRHLHSNNFSLDAAVFADSVTNSYDESKVLRSDAALPQSAETDKPFDIIIKSEPLDYQ